MANNDLHDLSVDLNQFAAALGGAAMDGVMTKLGVEAKKDAIRAANRDLGGDNRFSGWPKAALEARFDHTGSGAIAITPTPRSRGPWLVAESGRRAGSKYSKRRKRVVGWGATRGKNTWSDAEVLIEKETPERALDLLREVARGIVG